MVHVRANPGLGPRSPRNPHVWGRGQVVSIWSIKWRVINAGRVLRIQSFGDFRFFTRPEPK